MVEAARRNQRVVQVGTHRRSSPIYQELVSRTQGERYGKICISRAYRLSNMFPHGIGQKKPEKPPKELDWDMWLGPRPWQPYQETIAPYRFRWWQLFSSQMANWGVHYLDAIRWCTDELAPSSISSLGGNFAVQDDRTIPDTMEATFQFASGRIAVFGQYETSGNPIFPVSSEIELRGTLGTVYVNPRGFQVIPERGGQFQDRKPRMEAEELSDSGSNAHLTALHARNFLDCIRSRDLPNADVEIGHRSTTFSLLANISLSVKERLEWDAQEERFTNSEEANQLLHYEYRKPWKLG
jgi:predicted dehydrogenase